MLAAKKLAKKPVPRKKSTSDSVQGGMESPVTITVPASVAALVATVCAAKTSLRDRYQR